MAFETFQTVPLGFLCQPQRFYSISFPLLGCFPSYFPFQSTLCLHRAYLHCLLVSLMAKLNLIWAWLLLSSLLFCVSSSKDTAEPFPFYVHQLFATSVSFGMFMWQNATSLYISCLGSRENCLVLLDLFIHVLVFLWLKMCLFLSLNPFRFWNSSYWDVVASTAFLMLKYM